MPIFQGTLFYGEGVYGWSHVIYLNTADYNTAQAQLDAINTDILSLTQPNVSASFGRISDVAIKGDSLLFIPTIKVGQLSPDVNGYVDLNICAHCVFKTADLKHRVHHYIHGLRLGDVQQVQGQLQLKPASVFFTGLGSTFITDMLSRGVNWQLRSLPPVVAPLTTGAFGLATSIRRAGRPFGLPRGRRRTA